MKIAIHLSNSIVFFPQSDHPSAPDPLELLMCHWFGIGVGLSFVLLLHLTFPRLATNPLINSSPTNGLALAVGREASFNSDLSSAVAE